jgi:hypothetical protein
MGGENLWPPARSGKTAGGAGWPRRSGTVFMRTGHWLIAGGPRSG